MISTNVIKMCTLFSRNIGSAWIQFLILGSSTEEREIFNTYGSRKVRDSWDEDISAWDFEPVKGDCSSC